MSLPWYCFSLTTDRLPPNKHGEVVEVVYLNVHKRSPEALETVSSIRLDDPQAIELYEARHSYPGFVAETVERLKR